MSYIIYRHGGVRDGGVYWPERRRTWGHLIFANKLYFGGGYYVRERGVDFGQGSVRRRRGPYCLGLCGMTEGNTLLGVRQTRCSQGGCHPISFASIKIGIFCRWHPNVIVTRFYDGNVVHVLIYN